ncbi:SHOCT domain-containing protein [Streptomyces sp. NPDC005820]|uniref:SHOCT domain-containing protein n=1 Tax=Streptomyces sp. NPDC005820 TaxID=3157069 RepID=UPI003402DEC4
MEKFLRTTAAFIMLASLVAFSYSEYKIVNTGNCVSGGPFITDVDMPECPPGSTAWVWIMQGAVLTGVCAFWWLILIGRRTVFRLVGPPGPVLPDKQGTGHPSGNLDARAVGALRTRLFPPGAADGEPQDLPPAGDALARLERLGVLRSSGALTPAEFEQAKAKIMEEF